MRKSRMWFPVTVVGKKNVTQLFVATLLLTFVERGGSLKRKKKLMCEHDLRLKNNANCANNSSSSK